MNKKSIMGLSLIFTLVIGLFSMNTILAAKDEVDFHEYSGEQIFESVFLMNGELAEVLHGKGIVEEAEALEGTEEFREIVINKIKEDQPEFFMEFEEAIKSGNHVEIRDTLYKTSDYLNQLLAEENDLVLIEQQEDIISGYCYNLVVVIHTGAFLLFVLDTVAMYQHTIGPDTANSALAQEVLIDDLASIY